MTKRLVGKRAIVTGAGSGIGAAASLLFASEGAQVLCADIDGASAQATAAEAHNGAIGMRVDVSNPEDCAAMVDRAVDAFGGLDVVYANAGIAGSGRAGDLDVPDWDRVIAVNLTGVWLSIKYAIAHLEEAGGGSLVLQASVGGLIGVPGIAPYAAAKAGVIGLARQMAVDYGSSGIRVNAICPGTVPTPLVRATYEKAGGFAAVANLGEDAGYEDLIQAAAGRCPLGRLGTTDDIANLALYLASDESSWVTGASIAIDGGMSVA